MFGSPDKSLSPFPIEICKKVGRESVFNQRKQLPTIERTIFRDGVKLYGKLLLDYEVEIMGTEKG